MKKLWIVSLFCCLLAHSEEAVQVTNLQTYTHPKLGIQVIAGEVALPFGIYEFEAGEKLTHAFIWLEDDEAAMENRGARLQLVMREKRLRAEMRPIYEVHTAFALYADAHDGNVPDQEALREYLPIVEKNWLKPSIESAIKSLESGRYVIVSHERFARDGARVPVVVETQPLYDDGMHYVIFANRGLERVPIDQELMAAHGLEVEPREQLAEWEEMTHFYYRLVCQVKPGMSGVATAYAIAGNNMALRIPLTIDLDDASTNQHQIFEEWAEARAGELAEYHRRYPTSVMQHWLRIHKSAYGVDVGRDWQDSERSTSALGMLGGRAALRETLQLQDLQATNGGADAGRTIDISTVPGVQVEAHPYDEMLGDAPGGSLTIADLAPMDRFFIYFSKPQTMSHFLDRGQDFLHHAGALATSTSLRYELADAYYRRLGLSEAWARQLLDEGLAQEIAILLPDLFLIDGTDLTAIVRIDGIQSIAPLLQMIGVSGLREGVISEKALSGGGHSYWSIIGGYLVISTHRSEVERVLAVQAKPQESLGRSAEFRYMLTKLPVESSTEAFVYFSDPFIRHLTGPEVKLGQMRRLQARADLEGLTSAALLYQTEGFAEPVSKERLQAIGFINERLAGPEYELGDNLVASSRLWGRPGAMTTLLERPVRKINAEEQKVYQQYVEAYSRFWQQFFDPIAIRYNGAADGERQLEMFILPLVDNSIYNGVRDMLATSEAEELRSPIFAPEAVLTASLNLSEDAWQKITEGLSEILEHLAIDPAIVDQLGPSIHLAVKDADPVITLGSGDILGMFASSGMRGMDGEDLLMAPIMGTILTRPTQLAIELRDPQLVAQLLDQTVIGGSSEMDQWVKIDMVRVDPGDSWMLTFSLMGMIKLRYGLQVSGDYLLISNVPWSQWNSYAGERKDLLRSAAITVVPGAGVEQLPGLHAAAMEAEREAAFHGMTYLWPLLAGGEKDIDAAINRHRELFGFYPVHPGKGQWMLKEDNLIESNRFGSIYQPRQPIYVAGESFGLLQGIETATISMQLEDDGLRSRLVWKARANDATVRDAD